MPKIDPGHYVETAVLWVSRSFAGAFEVVSHLLTALVSAVQWALASPSPLVVIAMLSLLALLARRVVLAAFTLAAFALILSMDLWAPTVETLALVVVSTGVAVLIGIPLGIWCAVSAGISVTTRPVLDFMQTLPAYVYLIPAVFSSAWASCPRSSPPPSSPSRPRCV